MVRQIDPDLVMKLKDEVPDKSRMECKDALKESNGDLEKAKKKLSTGKKSKKEESKKDEEPGTIDSDLVLKLLDEVKKEAPDKNRMDCKKALIEAEGDFEKAKEILLGIREEPVKTDSKSKPKNSKKDEELDPEPIEETTEEPEEADNTKKDDKK